jgi:hypothetical protein
MHQAAPFAHQPDSGSDLSEIPGSISHTKVLAFVLVGADPVKPPSNR